MIEETITYIFKLPTGDVVSFQLDIHERDVRPKAAKQDNIPGWVFLEFNQCPNCTMDPARIAYCPLMLELLPIVERFQNIISYDELVLEVVTRERRIHHVTSAQRGIGSLMGLVMAMSGCPHTVYFRPMARFHLPLANETETIYRAVSMYLLAQYFLKQKGFTPDLELAGLKQIYLNVQKVNIAITQRLRAATKTDSSINAVILLDMFARALPVVIEDRLDEIEHLFADYLVNADPPGFV